MTTSTLRPSTAAGIAFVGVGVLVAGAAAPPAIQATVPHIRAEAAAVRLASNPLDDYQFVLQTAVDNAIAVLSTREPGLLAVIQQVVESQPASPEAITDALQTAVPAVLEQVTQTMPPLLRDALEKYNAGQPSAAVNTLLAIPVAVLRPVLMTNPALASVVVGLLGPIISGVSATVEAVENIGDTFGLRTAGQFVEAGLKAPAMIADGILNGGYGPNFNPDPASPTVVLAGGVFSPGSSTPGRAVLPGPIATLTGHGPDPVDFATVPEPTTLSLAVGDTTSSPDDVQSLDGGAQQQSADEAAAPEKRTYKKKAHDLAKAVSGEGKIAGTDKVAATDKKVTKRPIRNAIKSAAADVRASLNKLNKLGNGAKKNQDKAGTTPADKQDKNGGDN
jgi:hypothetical protein